MSRMTGPFEIGQSVHILPAINRPGLGSDVYTVLRCNEADSRNPSYVLQNRANQQQRREFHNQLVSVAASKSLFADPFRRQEIE